MARSRPLRITGIVSAALCLALAAPAAPAAAATDLLPDLVADPPTNPELQTYVYPDGATHLLLRFDGYIDNHGPGALEMRGSQRVGATMTQTAQRIYRSDGSYYDDTGGQAEIVWEPADGHYHWHLKAAARWSLWDSTRTAEAAPGMKVGFCASDSEQMSSAGPDNAYYTYDSLRICTPGQPTASSTVMGVSAGWRDSYPASTAFQWVDATEVQPGRYWLRAEVDPQNYVREADEVNTPAFAEATSTIPGYRAKPVNAGVVSGSSPTTLSLATDSFGSGLGARAFQVTTPPQHGRLSVESGSSFSSPSVTYTPSAGWSGPDNFTYEAYDSSSSFPAHPATAAVSLNVNGVSPNVAISGAPASMLAGTTARLSATVIGDDPLVGWTVDGVSLGAPQSSIVYTAPAHAPVSGHVTIRATSAYGAFGEVTIGITNPPFPQPAPSIGKGSHFAPVHGRVLRGIRLGTDGQAVIVELRSRRAGLVRVRVGKGRRVLGRCRARISPGRTVTCRAPLHGVWPGGTRVVITLGKRGKVIDVVRTALSEAQAQAGIQANH